MLPGTLQIYTEKNTGFAKTSVSGSVPVAGVSAAAAASVAAAEAMSPLELGLATQAAFRALATFCHGLLAGLAAAQVFAVYTLHSAGDELGFVALYSPLSQPAMIAFYLLTVVCVVSVCDRYDVCEASLGQARRCVTLQSGCVAVLVYWATLVLTLVTTKVGRSDEYQIGTQLCPGG